MFSIFNLGIGFLINFTIALLIVRFIYYPQSHNKNFVFTSLAFNTIIFFLLAVLGNSTLSLGVGFGLFALFSMLRYRTDTLPSREMTYLFSLIALPAINSLLFDGQSLLLMILVNLVVVLVLLVLEKGWGFHYEYSRKIVYDNIELLKPECEMFLLSDLQHRTGMPIKHVEVKNMNLVNGTATISVYYDEPQSERDPLPYLSPSQFHAVSMERFSSGND